jgi:hypothetical protein
MLYSIVLTPIKEPEMETAQVRSFRQRLRDLRQKMAQLGPVMRGSVVVIGTRNKQPYFSLNKDKRTKLIYLGRRREPKAREFSDNYKTLLAIIEEMTIINMELLKNDACDQA